MHQTRFLDTLASCTVMCLQTTDTARMMRTVSESVENTWKKNYNVAGYKYIPLSHNVIKIIVSDNCTWVRIYHQFLKMHLDLVLFSRLLFSRLL